MFALQPKVAPNVGVFVDALSGPAAVIISFTGLFGGAAHYGAILAKCSDQDIERITGVGFFTGAFVAFIAIGLDTLT